MSGKIDISKLPAALNTCKPSNAAKYETIDGKTIFYDANNNVVGDERGYSSDGNIFGAAKSSGAASSGGASSIDAKQAANQALNQTLQNLNLNSTFGFGFPSTDDSGFSFTSTSGSYSIDPGKVMSSAGFLGAVSSLAQMIPFGLGGMLSKGATMNAVASFMRAVSFNFGNSSVLGDTNGASGAGNVSGAGKKDDVPEGYEKTDVDGVFKKKGSNPPEYFKMVDGKMQPCDKDGNPITDNANGNNGNGNGNGNGAADNDGNNGVYSANRFNNAVDDKDVNGKAKDYSARAHNDGRRTADITSKQGTDTVAKDGFKAGKADGSGGDEKVQEGYYKYVTVTDKDSGNKYTYEFVSAKDGKLIYKFSKDNSTVSGRYSVSDGDLVTINIDDENSQIGLISNSNNVAAKRKSSSTGGGVSPQGGVTHSSTAHSNGTVKKNNTVSHSPAKSGTTPTSSTTHTSTTQRSTSTSSTTHSSAAQRSTSTSSAKPSAAGAGDGYASATKLGNKYAYRKEGNGYVYYNNNGKVTSADDFARHAPNVYRSLNHISQTNQNGYNYGINFGNSKNSIKSSVACGVDRDVVFTINGGSYTLEYGNRTMDYWEVTNQRTAGTSTGRHFINPNTGIMDANSSFIKSTTAKRTLSGSGEFSGCEVLNHNGKVCIKKGNQYIDFNELMRSGKKVQVK